MPELLLLLKQLISLPGLSGYESPVCDLLEGAWGPLTNEIRFSRLGSLHALRRGQASQPPPSPLLAAQMDGVGLGALLLPGQLVTVHGRVSDSGAGRWMELAAVDESVLSPVIIAALFSRFSSRGENEFADKLLSTMRPEFSGHSEE